MPNTVYDNEGQDTSEDGSNKPQSLFGGESASSRKGTPENAEQGALGRSLVGRRGETSAPDHGPSAYADIASKLGAGYRDDKEKSTLSKWYHSASKNKRRLAIIGVAGGGSGTLIAVLFMMLVPLRIETMITNLDNRFSAASNQAIEETSSNLFSTWVARNIIPNLLKGTCRSTVSAGCVSVDSNTGPVGKIFNGWRQSRMEQKLAERHDIVIGRQGNRLYINFPQGNASITDSDAQRLIRGETDIFTLASENSRNRALRVDRSELRKSLNDAIKEQTLWRRVYDRYQFGKFLEQKYGVRRCAIACDSRDKFTDKYEDKKLFAKAIFIQRVIQPLSTNYAFMFTCILDAGQGCGTEVQDAGSGDTEAHTEAEKKIRTNLSDYAGRLGPQKTEKLVAASKDIAEKGMTDHLTKAIADKIMTALFGKTAGAVTGKAAASAIPFAGWAIFFAQLADAAQNIGPAIQAVGYAANAAAAVQTYSIYATVVAEMHSGHMDSTQLGTLSEALSTNMTGSPDDRSDATQTPLYQEYNGTGSGQTMASLFTSTAFANTSSENSKAYVCNDGKPVPEGELVCEEENFSRGNESASKISEVVTEGLKGTFIGDEFVAAIGWAGGLINKLFEIDQISDAINFGCKFAPGCRTMMGAMEEYGPVVMEKLMKHILESPFTENMSGGRIYDMVAGGAVVSHAESCQTVLGCAEISDEQAAAIQSDYLAEQREAFSKKPFFARMFSTDSPYSLVSKVAVSTPGTRLSMRDTMASFFANPMGAFQGLFSTMGASLSGNMQSSASAAVSAANPFGVPQTGYTDIPKDPVAYWEQNCVNGLMAKYDAATQKLDVSDWLNRMEKHPDTGQAIAKETNPCLLIHTTIIATGATSDPSLLPESTTSTTVNTGVGASFRMASFNICYSGPDEGSCPSIINVSNWEQRLENSMRVIREYKLDVVALQEVRLNQWQKLKNDLAADYDIYTDVGEAAGYALQNPIIWNKHRFEKVDDGTKTITGSKVKGGTNQKDANTQVKLRSLEGGQEFYVISVHEPVGSPAERRYDSANYLVEKIKALNGDGLPVFVVGDFNSKYNPSQDRQGVHKEISYCILTRTGLVWDAFDAFKKRDGECPSKNKDDRPRDVDHIYMSVNVQATSYNYSIQRGADKNGSDHNTLYADVVIPGSGSTDGGTATPGEGFVGNDGFPGGSCVAYVKHILARHSSKYKGGSLGDGKDVARNLGGLGYTVNNVPAVHATVSFPTSMADPTYGHVAIVAKVNADGSIVVEEANWDNDDSYGTHEVSAADAKKLTYAHTEEGWH